MDTKAEIPGQWYFPCIASLITGGGRLLLGILEKEVANPKGSYLMTDTDSMAIIANERGGLIPCPGGPHKMPDGHEAVKALSRREVTKITEHIQKLSPTTQKSNCSKSTKRISIAMAIPISFSGLAIPPSDIVCEQRKKSSSLASTG